MRSAYAASRKQFILAPFPLQGGGGGGEELLVNNFSKTEQFHFVLNICKEKGGGHVTYRIAGNNYKYLQGERKGSSNIANSR